MIILDHSSHDQEITVATLQMCRMFSENCRRLPAVSNSDTNPASPAQNYSTPFPNCMKTIPQIQNTWVWISLGAILTDGRVLHVLHRSLAELFARLLCQELPSQVRLNHCETCTPEYCMVRRKKGFLCLDLSVWCLDCLVWCLDFEVWCLDLPV